MANTWYNQGMSLDSTDFTVTMSNYKENYFKTIRKHKYLVSSYLFRQFTVHGFRGRQQKYG